jgi:hypothetical protein
MAAFYRGWGVGLGGWVLGLGLAGCVHPAAVSLAKAPIAPVDRSRCSSAVPAADDGCSVAQRVCLVVAELPAALSDPDFIADPSYQKTWQPRVQSWSAHLALLAADPQLGIAALDLSSVVDLLAKGAKQRREIVSAPALASSSLRALGEAAQKAVAPAALGCPLPADPVAAPPG